MKFVVALIVGLLLPPMAIAGKWLDYLRSYDLNDYAVGVAVTARQSPYDGGENTTYAYPYLTSLRHPTMHDNWFVIRDGELGLRRVHRSGWEFGFYSRIQTLGFGNHDSEALRGVSEPEWTVELAPSIGWRGWPVQLSFTAFFEPTDRHSGVSSRLSVAYPIPLARGYLVPELQLVHQDSDYTNYYYAVSDLEARPDRPSYDPGSATNTRLRLVWGYRLTPNWLINGRIAYEFLDAAIYRSPIVDRRELWSAGIGVAYNAGVFRGEPYESPVDAGQPFNLQVGLFNTRVDTRIGREAVAGIPGDEIDLERLFGEPDDDTVIQLDAMWRIQRYHRIEAGYFELVRSGNIELDQETRFGDSVLTAGDRIQSRSHFKSIRLGYGFSLIRDEQKELGVMGGVHFSSFDALIVSADGNQRDESRLDAPLPVVGFFAAGNIGQQTRISLRGHLFRTDYDNYEGSLNFAAVDVQHQLTTSFSVGIGYNYYRMKLRSSDEDLRGYVEIRHRGPVLFAGIRF